MHKIFNPINLLNQDVRISYHPDDFGEDAKVIEIESKNNERTFEIVFSNCPELEDDERFIWTTQEPYEIIDDKAVFSNIGHMRRIYLQCEKLEYIEEVTSETNNMKTTVKELSEKLGVDVVYVNGFIQTLIKIGKAEVIGKTERPAGSRGKPSNIYQIAEGIL
jgi:hypothetical protein